jgi:EAL domain-containing protein (putative c-di-GMP-specific phosphodiesterase class I)
VLVVDDEPANVALLERLLGLAGVREIYTALDPRSAIALYDGAPCDLVLLDLHMPGMDGVAVLEELRSRPSDDFVPVIVLTADATSEARARALAAGANDFLTKPFDRVEVLLRARNLLHTRSLHRRVQAHNAELRAELDRQRAAEERSRADRAAKHGRVAGVLRGDALRVVFQPIARLATGDGVGYEALARFTGEPRRGPAAWFAEAAQVGLGQDLELAAARAALEHLAEIPPHRFMSINVSPTTTSSAQLAALLERHGADRVVLEITEHDVVDDYGSLHRALAPLRARGIRLAVDDAGAGFASLQHILELAPEMIKLDMALVRGIDGDPVKRALASALVAFGDEIGSVIIAEGIETPGELRVLADLGIPCGQGFLIARPGAIAGAPADGALPLNSPPLPFGV